MERGSGETPDVRFEFEAPADHLEYYRAIAEAMAASWPISLADAEALINARVRDDDHYGKYACLLFHEDPGHWVDLYYQHSLGNLDYRPTR